MFVSACSQWFFLRRCLLCRQTSWLPLWWNRELILIFCEEENEKKNCKQSYTHCLAAFHTKLLILEVKVLFACVFSYDFCFDYIFGEIYFFVFGSRSVHFEVIELRDFLLRKFLVKIINLNLRRLILTSFRHAFLVLDWMIMQVSF